MCAVRCAVIVGAGTAGGLGGVPYTSWLLLLIGPLLFLVGIVGASVLLSVRGVEPERIAERVPRLMPYLLLGVLLGLLVLLVGLRPAALGEIWSIPDGPRLLRDGVVGAFVGAVLGVGYVVVLAPFLGRLQQSVGDYVPPGSVLPTLSGSLPAFFVANVLLAPAVEETLYRGYALPLFTEHAGVAAAVVLSCLCFGLLHWPGGFWYVALTGGLAGGTFAGLFLWSGSVFAPFVAHLVVNVIEFGYARRDDTQDVTS